jgi:hypothetical protein
VLIAGPMFRVHARAAEIAGIMAREMEQHVAASAAAA